MGDHNRFHCRKQCTHKDTETSLIMHGSVKMEVMIPFYICNMHGNVCADVAQGERGWLGCSTVREGGWGAVP